MSNSTIACQLKYKSIHTSTAFAKRPGVSEIKSFLKTNLDYLKMNEDFCSLLAVKKAKLVSRGSQGYNWLPMAVLTAYATADFLVQYLAPSERVVKAIRIPPSLLEFLRVSKSSCLKRVRRLMCAYRGLAYPPFLPSISAGKKCRTF